MALVPSNFRPDVRPIGSDGTVLTASGDANYDMMWANPLLLLDRSYPKITGFAVNSGYILMGTGFTNPQFTIAYDGTPTGAVISGPSGSAVINSPFNNAVLSGVFLRTSHGSSYTFNVTASGTASGSSSDLNVYWVNQYYMGIASDPGTYNTAFVKSLAVSGQTNLGQIVGHTGFYSAVLNSGIYMWYAFRSAAGTPSFTCMETHFKAGFTQVGSVLAFFNDAGRSEVYQVWRSNQHGLGRFTVMVGSG